MLWNMLIIGVLLLVIALCQTVVGVLAWGKKLPGNPYVGLRVPQVRTSQEAWDAAHRIAGPLWTAGGLTLLMGGVLALTAHGWMWLLVLAAVVLWLLFLGTGAGTAAKAASLFETADDDAEGGCCSEGTPAPEAQQPADAAPAPQVDLDALRRAAHNSNG